MSDLSWFFKPQHPVVAAPSAPLFTASSRGDAQMLKTAIAEGGTDMLLNGWCSYHVAAAKGHVECLEVLQGLMYPAPGALLVTLTSGGLNALHLAAKNAHVPACSFLIQTGGDDAVDSLCSNKHSALMISCHAGHIDVVRFLIAAGANSGATSDEGMTPLLFASSAGHLEVLQLMCELPDGGGLLSAITSSGHNALHKASAAGHLCVVEYLLQLREKILEDTRHRKSDGASGGPIVARLPFVKIDSVSSSGASSLHMASQGGYLGTVAALVRAGANVNLMTEVGQTSLHKAAFEGHYDVVELLLSEGNADARLLDQKGYTVLMCAAAGGRHRIVDRVLSWKPSTTGHSDGVNKSETKSLSQDMTYVGATLQSGQNAAVIAAENGFTDLASKLTRYHYLGMRRNTLLGALVSTEATVSLPNMRV